VTSGTFSAIYGELRPCTEKRFSLSYSRFHAASDSVNNSGQWKSPFHATGVVPNIGTLRHVSFYLQVIDLYDAFKKIMMYPIDWSAGAVD